MKKLIILSIGVVTLITGFSSCKKGENDPALSLKSRRARLAGEWVVTKEESTTYSKYTTGGGGPTTTTVTGGSSTYDGTNHTSTSTSTSTSSLGGTPMVTTYSNTYAYTTNYTFEKDGKFKMENVSASPASTTTYEGNWSFVGKSKTVELKNKEAILLSVTKMTQSQGGVTTTESATGYEMTVVMMLDQLKSKEIVMINESSSTESNGDTNTSKTTTTLTAK